MGDTSFSSMNSPHHSTPTSRKRQTQQASRSAATVATPIKKPRISSGLADGAATPVDVPSSSSSQSLGGPPNNADPHMIVDVKSEQPTYDDDEAQRHPEYHAGEEDDDDDIQEIPVEGDEGNSRSHLGPGVGDGFNHPDQQQLQPYNAGFGSGQLLPDGTDMVRAA